MTKQESANLTDEPLEDLDPTAADTDGVAGGITMVELPAVQHGGGLHVESDPNSGLPTG